MRLRRGGSISNVPISTQPRSEPPRFCAAGTVMVTNFCNAFLRHDDDDDDALIVVVDGDRRRPCAIICPLL